MLEWSDRNDEFTAGQQLVIERWRQRVFLL